ELIGGPSRRLSHLTDLLAIDKPRLADQRLWDWSAWLRRPCRCGPAIACVRVALKPVARVRKSTVALNEPQCWRFRRQAKKPDSHRATLAELVRFFSGNTGASYEARCGRQCRVGPCRDGRRRVVRIDARLAANQGRRSGTARQFGGHAGRSP